MRFLHIADLHLGKIVNDFSMLEDQKYILEQISGMAEANQVNGVVIAGDVYDRAIPPGQAVTLLDSFLTSLSERGIWVVMVSGNHDSPERLSFGGSLLQKQGVYIAGIYQETLTKLLVKEEACTTQFVLLPFCKPAQAGAGTSEEMVRNFLTKYWEEEGKREDTVKTNHVLVTHFFVTNQGKEPELTDGETTIHVGGLDNVDVSLFRDFDYVALGHIHKPQQIGKYPVWYAGSPLKYSFGESGQTKSALLVTLDGKGLGEVSPLPLRPLREMKKIKGSLKELMEAANDRWDGAQCQDYIQAVLTDKGELIDPIGTLRSRYPNMMQIVREETFRHQSDGKGQKGQAPLGKKEIPDLFEAFYQEVRGEALSGAGRKVIVDIAGELEGRL